MRSLMDCPASQLFDFFYKHDTTDFCGDKTQNDYKDHEFKVVTWNNLYCKGVSAEGEISPN